MCGALRSPKGRLPGAILNYASEALRGANLAEITNSQSSGGVLDFSLSWSDGFGYDITIRQDVRGAGEIATSLTLRKGKEKVTFRVSDPESHLYDAEVGDKHEQGTIRFDGLRPNPTTPFANHVINDMIADACDRLSILGEDVHWISAVRSQPPRLFMLEPGVPIRVQPDGTGTAEALRASAIANDGVAQQVSEWLSKTCGCRLGSELPHAFPCAWQLNSWTHRSKYLSKMDGLIAPSFWPCAATNIERSWKALKPNVGSPFTAQAVLMNYAKASMTSSSKIRYAT